MKSRALGSSQAYVLHQHDWSESSLILELFTREHGRLAVAAKGAKKPASNWRPVLLPFQRLQVACTRSAQEEVEIHNLRSVEWAGPSVVLRGDAYYSAFYLNELLLKLLARGEAQPALFDTYHHTLPALAGDDDNHAQAALRAFECLLLQQQGWLPELDRDTATQQPLQPSARYALESDAGLRPARGDEAALSGAQWLALGGALARQDLAAAQAASLPVLAQLRSLLRGALHYHLGAQELRTRRLLADAKQLLPSPPGRSAGPPR